MSKINIQDQLLYQARRERIPIKIFLLRGLQLIGRISAYDMYSVLLESQGRLQLIFKHAISTIEFPEKIKISAQEGEHGHHGRPGEYRSPDRGERPGPSRERAPAPSPAAAESKAPDAGADKDDEDEEG